MATPIPLCLCVLSCIQVQGADIPTVGQPTASSGSMPCERVDTGAVSSFLLGKGRTQTARREEEEKRKIYFWIVWWYGSIPTGSHVMVTTTLVTIWRANCVHVCSSSCRPRKVSGGAKRCWVDTITRFLIVVPPNHSYPIQIGIHRMWFWWVILKVEVIKRWVIFEG